ncbi:UDP-glycosyltransferase family 35 member B1 [Carabus blaptoides fortunei]
MKLYLTVICTVLVGYIVCDGARILAIFPVTSPSHNILAVRLMKELVGRGHEVTMVSPYQQTETENYNAILLTGLAKRLELRKDISKMLKGSHLTMFQHVTQIFTRYTQSTLNHTNFQKLLKSNAKFDLIIIEAMFSEALVGVGYRFSAPVILLSAMSTNLAIYKYVGIPTSGSTLPCLTLGFTGVMTFPQRLLNTVVGWSMDLYHQFYHLRVHNELLHQYFPDAPELQDVLRKYVALVLLNSDPSFDVVKPLVPNMIHIGGYHVEEPKELPQVTLHDITEETLSEAIKEVVNNNIYSTNVRMRSRLMRDQPQRPIDTAMFWIEYVLRNKNSSHLKNPAIYLEWHQIQMLDIYATLAGGIILVSAIFYLLLKKICCSKKDVKKYSQELRTKKTN